VSRWWATRDASGALGSAVRGGVPLFLAVLALGAAAVCRTPAVAQQRGALELRFLDVGQGDAILIRNGGNTVLVDAGETGGITARLRRLGVDTIDLAIASHSDHDHIGGMDAVLRTLPVRAYLDNGVPKTTRIQSTVLELVRDRGVAYLQAVARRVEVGDATIRVLPSPVVAARVAQNDLSIVVTVERGAFRALLTGDSERRELAALLRGKAVVDVDVLKAPHHGSRAGFLDAFLARARPEVIVISVGEGNPFGHPHAQALAAYQVPGRTVLRTDRDGDVVVTVDTAGCYEVRSARSGAAVLARGGPAACTARAHEETRP
jgi:competence protein ComEC